ncbi:MAG: CDP-alcohol phosphatidyltransferase family protein [Desulfobacterales bacterium]
MGLRESGIARWLYGMLDRQIVPRLPRAWATPNALTVLGTAVAALVPVGFYLHPGVGVVAIGLSGLIDILDGHLARGLGQDTVYGAFLDSTLDRAADFFYLCGFWVLMLQCRLGAGATLLIFSAGLTTQLISYTKARAEGLGVTCTVGLMARAPRVLFLLGWGLLFTLWIPARNALLWWGTGSYLMLTLGTVLQRMGHVRRSLAASATANFR